MKNWRPAQPTPPPPPPQQQPQPSAMDGVVGGGDWRFYYGMECRQRIVSEMMETLKRHLPFYGGQEGLHELKNIADSLEKKIYNAATSQSDYLRKISLEMLSVETSSQNQNLMTNSLRSNFVGNGIIPPYPAAKSDRVDDGGVEAKMCVTHSLLVARRIDMFRLASNVIETAVVSEEASEVLRESLELAHEKIKLMNANKYEAFSTTNDTSSQGIFNNQCQVRGKGCRKRLHEGKEKRKERNRQFNSLGKEVSLDSTAQTGHANGGDWQEEVYQKIKTMKEMYLPELNEMYQKIAAKLQQHDSLPQQLKTEQLEKLKIFKNMLERLITYLQVSKSNITVNYKEKFGSYERQIINFINTNRPRKPVSSMQHGQLPPPHMHSLQQTQSQITQGQPHENQSTLSLQAINFQGSVATMQQNNMTNMQHGSISSSSVVPNPQQNMMNSLQSGSNLDSVQGAQVNEELMSHFQALSLLLR